jgi:hypothetical protein
MPAPVKKGGFQEAKRREATAVRAAPLVASGVPKGTSSTSEVDDYRLNMSLSASGEDETLKRRIINVSSIFIEIRTDSDKPR